MADGLPIRKSPADQAIVALIKGNIRTQVWRPGDRLPTERELAKVLGSSRNTLRRGLQLLETQGIITRQIGRGTFVSGIHDLENAGLLDANSREPSMDRSRVGDFVRRASPLEILEVRLMIEPAAASMAAARATTEDISILKSHLDQALAADDFDRFEQIDALLHMQIVLSTRNRLLSDIYGEISAARIEPAWKELKRKRLTEAQRARYQAEHEGVIAAIANRDAALARTLSIDHLRQVKHDLGLEF